MKTLLFTVLCAAALAGCQTSPDSAPKRDYTLDGINQTLAPKGCKLERAGYYRGQEVMVTKCDGRSTSTYQ